MHILEQSSFCGPQWWNKEGLWLDVENAIKKANALKFCNE